MARPKAAFIKDLAKRAKTDLDIVDSHGVAVKLKAIAAASTHAVTLVADIMGVAKQTVGRWIKTYQENGLEGLYHRPKKGKSSKLTQVQKEKVLQWLNDAKTPTGRHAHWTLEKLRHAIAEEFGVSLGINTIWVWLRKEGLKPKIPRPRHCEADTQAQEDFKKNS